MSNHLTTVKCERALYPTPLGLENAWKTINAVAYIWRAEGWGLLDKPGGTRWNNCSVDVIINPHTKEAIDCLGDSENAGIPQWGVIAYLPDFDSRWIAPTSGAPGPPTPPDPPTPPTPPGVVVTPGDKLVSPNGTFTASMQNDGNLVIYRRGIAIWASNSALK